MVYNESVKKPYPFAGSESLCHAQLDSVLNGKNVYDITVKVLSISTCVDVVPAFRYYQR